MTSSLIVGNCHVTDILCTTQSAVRENNRKEIKQNTQMTN